MALSLFGRAYSRWRSSEQFGSSRRLDEMEFNRRRLYLKW
jgi:hypothetical protein